MTQLNMTKRNNTPNQLKRNPKSGIEQVVGLLLRAGKRGITPAEIQEKTGLSRRYSDWDMDNLAKAYGYKVVRVAKEGRTQWYRFEVRKPRAPKATNATTPAMESESGRVFVTLPAAVADEIMTKLDASTHG